MISMRLDGVEQILERMTQLEQRRLPFAVSLALNKTAKEFQQAMRVGISRRFTLRRPAFILGLVHIPRGGASNVKAGRYTAEIVVGGSEPGSKSFRSRGLLAKFEGGGQKQSRDEMMPVAVPTPSLRPSFAEMVPRALFPKNLRLQERRTPDGTLGPKVHVTGTGKAQIKGKRRTFVLGQPGQRGWGVFQRTGPKKGDIRMLWSYRMRVPIPRRLQFADTARGMVPGAWRKNLREALGQALDRFGGSSRARDLTD
jgi:hypothetical protein